MTTSHDDTPPEELKICWSCIREKYLQSEIKHKGVSAVCDYCQCRSETIFLTDLADRIERIIHSHFCRTASEPNYIEQAIIRDGGNWERKGQPIQELIAEISEIDEKPAGDVLLILQETHYDKDNAEIGEEEPFDDDTHYDVTGVDDTALQNEWRLMLRSLQQKSRLFNRPVEEFLQNIFGNLDSMTTQSGVPVVVTAGPDSSLAKLFRARVFQSEQDLVSAMKRPDNELGPPPSQVASAGRMNSQGVAVFYGATDKSVALAETRPPVGSSVLIGCFCIIRPLRLIDLLALEEVANTAGSYFDPEFHPALQKHAFLHHLSEQMTKPVMPGDEASDYLVTQAIADFLASRESSEYDGIIYPSVQSKSERNVVLFHKAARVLELDIPIGTDISAQCHRNTEEGLEADYAVVEQVPSRALNKDVSLFLPPSPYPSTEDDTREATTAIDKESIWVHVVKSVSYTTDDHPVSRMRRDKVELNISDMSTWGR